MTSVNAGKYRVVFTPLEANVVHNCECCEKPFDNPVAINLCQTCGFVAYCSNECRERDAESHSKWCKNFVETHQWHSAAATKQLARYIAGLSREEIKQQRLMTIHTVKNGSSMVLKPFTSDHIEQFTEVMLATTSKNAFGVAVVDTVECLQSTPAKHSIVFAEFCDGDFRVAPVSIVYKDTCAKCYKKAPDGKLWMMCARCKSEAYCGDECARADWPNHKKICKKIKPQ